MSSSLNRTSGPRICSSPPRRSSAAHVAIVLATTLTAIAAVCLTVRAIPPRPADSLVRQPEPAAALLATVLPRPSPLAEPAPTVLRTRPAVQEVPVLPRPAEVPAPVAVVRRPADEETLLRELSRVPEITLYTSFTTADAVRLAARLSKDRRTETLPDPFLERQGLTPLRGNDCKLTAEAASHLNSGSQSMQLLLMRHKLPSRKTTLDLDKGPRSSFWTQPEAVPTLMQMLMAESRDVRAVLIATLAKIDGPQASAALASRAVTELDPELRESAIDCLRKRPAEEYVPTLVKALRYPWLPVAEHAADALSALKPKGATAAMLAVTDEPDPTAPYVHPDTGVRVVREVVRINHLRGCLMCHPASTSNTDKVRGGVPQTERPLRPSYGSKGGILVVRADVTYLRQDFSVQLTVPESKPWPAAQRFDILVRERPATADEQCRVPAEGGTPHDRTLVHALKGVSGKDHGPVPADWKKAYVDQGLKPRKVHSGFTRAVGMAVTETGVVYVAEPFAVLRRDDDGEPLLHWHLSSERIRGLALDGKGGLVVAFERRPQLHRLDLSSEALVPLGVGAALDEPGRPAVDEAGGSYVCDRNGKLHYLSTGATRSGLAAPAAVRAVALAPDGRALYLASANEVWRCPVKSGGDLGPARRVAKVAGIADLAVGRSEVVCVAHAGGVAVYSPEGLRLAKAGLAEQPAALAVRGTTLHVLSRQSLYEVDLSGVARP